MGGPLLGFLPSTPDCRRPEAPRPTPCRGEPDWEQLIPIQHCASLAQGILHSLVPVERDALPTTASLWTRASQALCSLSAAKSWRWSLLNHLHPPPACYPSPGVLHPQGSHTAQHRGWRCCFLRSHLHVLPRRAWTGLSHHVQDVTLVPLVMGLVMGSPLEKLYDNSTVLVTCPCSSHGGAEAGQDTPAPRAGDSLWLPTGTECSLWAHTQQEVTPSPAWHSCRLANYRNNCTRPPAQAAAGHSGSEASPTGSLGTLGDTGHISSAPSGSVRPEELHQEILLLSMKSIKHKLTEAAQRAPLPWELQQLKKVPADGKDGPVRWP